MRVKLRNRLGDPPPTSHHRNPKAQLAKKRHGTETDLQRHHRETSENPQVTQDRHATSGEILQQAVGSQRWLHILTAEFSSASFMKSK
jgi:hypothetical protein